MQLLTYIIRQSLVFQNIFHWTCNQCQRSAKFVRNICKKAKLYIRNLLFHRHFMFQTINGKQYIYSWKQNQQKSKNINCHSPSRFPKRRLNGDSQTALILYPNPITIGRFNLKYIIPFRQIGVCSGTLFIHIIPFLIKSMQTISITDIFRINHIQGCKGQSYNILLVRKYQVFCIIKRLSQQTAWYTRNHLLIGYFQRSENNGWNIIAFLDMFRFKIKHTTTGAKE